MLINNVHYCINLIVWINQSIIFTREHTYSLVYRDGVVRILFWDVPSNISEVFCFSASIREED